MTKYNESENSLLESEYNKLFLENKRLQTIIDFLQITIRDQHIVIFQQKEKL